jgi:hypothetical protein
VPEAAIAAASARGGAGAADDHDARSIGDRRPEGTDRVVHDHAGRPAAPQAFLQERDVLGPVGTGHAERVAGDARFGPAGLGQRGCDGAMDHLHRHVRFHGMDVC